MSEPPTTDPVLVRRARIARLVGLGRRIGWACVGVAVAGFVVGVVTGFPSVVAVVVTVALALTTVTLAPAIVFGYGLKAAEREDRERGV